VSLGRDEHQQSDHGHEPLLDRVDSTIQLFERDRAEQRNLAEDNERVLQPIFETEPNTPDIELGDRPVGEAEPAVMMRLDAQFLEQAPWQNRVRRACVDDEVDGCERTRLRTAYLDANGERAHRIVYTGLARSAKVA